MKKILITITAFAVVGLGSIFTSAPVSAQTIDELKAKQSEVKDERAEVKKDLSKAEAQVADVLFDLKEINEEIDVLQEELEENKKMMTKAENSITKSEEEIAIIESEIEELEENIAIRFEILKQRAASLQKSGGNTGYMDVLFGATSFNEFISRAAAVIKITESDSELIRQQEVDKAQVEGRQAEFEIKLNEQLDMKDELEGMAEFNKEQQEAQKDKKATLKKKEKELTSLVKELKTDENALSALESQVKHSIARLTNPVASTSNVLTTVGKTTSRGSSPVAAAPSVNSSSAISAGYSQIGARYVTAGKGPSGFDCSGFVSWAYGQTGKNIPSGTRALRGMGQKVSLSNAQPGDLIFFNTNRTDGHVGIYLGGGQFIGSQSSTGVAVASLSSSYWSKAFKGHVRRVN